MGPPEYLAGEYVSTLPHLDHLCPHQLVLRWVTMLLLGLEEDWKGARDEVGLPVSNESLIFLFPVSEERRGALQPLEP